MAAGEPPREGGEGLTCRSSTWRTPQTTQTGDRSTAPSPVQPRLLAEPSGLWRAPRLQPSRLKTHRLALGVGTPAATVVLTDCLNPEQKNRDPGVFLNGQIALGRLVERLCLVLAYELDHPFPTQPRFSGNPTPLHFDPFLVVVVNESAKLRVHGMKDSFRGLCRRFQSERNEVRCCGSPVPHGALGHTYSLPGP